MSIKSHLPEDFDIASYRKKNDDLDLIRDEDLADHYWRYGQYEGRSSATEMGRELFVNEIVSKEAGPILEIGPYNCPSLRGANVRYLDVFDSDELRRRSLSAGMDPGGCPDVIDYTCPLSDVAEDFAAIFSSHAIEHQPDLVQHFIDVGEKLVPGGYYYIVIPDKRYCFDALQQESTIGGVLQAHREKRTRHTFENIVGYFVERTHNNAVAHWNGEVAYPEIADPLEAIGIASHYFDSAAGDYVDTHAWRFTPDSLRKISMALYRLGLIKLHPLRIYGTPKYSLEFCCVFRNGEPFH